MGRVLVATLPPCVLWLNYYVALVFLCWPQVIAEMHSSNVAMMATKFKRQSEFEQENSKIAHLTYFKQAHRAGHRTRLAGMKYNTNNKIPTGAGTTDQYRH